MKLKDIDNFEIGNSCYSDILAVNGKDYEELSKKEVIEFINDMFENGNSIDELIRDTFKNSLDYLPYQCVEDNCSSCEQCGNWNSYNKCIIIKDDK